MRLGQGPACLPVLLEKNLVVDVAQHVPSPFERRNTVARGLKPGEPWG
jgi:hypothetical protein